MPGYSKAPWMTGSYLGEGFILTNAPFCDPAEIVIPICALWTPTHYQNAVFPCICTRFDGKAKQVTYRLSFRGRTMGSVAFCNPLNLFTPIPELISAGLFGDPYIGDTELDGNSPFAAASTLAKMCGKLQQTNDQLGWGINNAIVQQVKELFEESLALPGGSHLSERIGNLQKKIRGMPVDKFICLQSGWTTPDGGHAITVNFHKTSADKISIIVVNSGQGVGSHPSRSCSWPLSTGGMKLAMRFDNIPLSRASDEVGLWMLLKQNASADADHKPFAFYEIYLPYVLNRSLADGTAPTFKHGHDARAGDWMKPQRAGTCYFRGNYATLRYYARMRGMSRDEVKRFVLLLRVQFMLCLQQDMRESLRGANGLSVWPSDRALIRMGIHQTAYHTLKHQKSGLVTDKEARDVDEVLRPFEDELLPACKPGEWVDRGHVPPRLVKDVTWRPMTGRIDTIFMKDERATLEGAAVSLAADDGMDLLSGEDLPCSTFDEVMTAIEQYNQRMDKCWEHSEDSYGAAMASRIGKQFILERLPFDSIGWMGAKSDPDPSIGHPCGSLSKDQVSQVSFFALMTLQKYLSYAYYAPKMDDAGVAERQACSLAVLYFVLATMRYGCPADQGSFVTKMLRAIPAEEPKTLRFSAEGVESYTFVQTTAAGESLESLMEFWSCEDPAVAVAKQRILGCKGAEDAALRAIEQARGKRRAARGRGNFATIQWATGQEGKSFKIQEGGAHYAELALDIAAELGLPLVCDLAKQECAKAHIDSPETKCPPFIRQVCMLCSLDISGECAEYGHVQSLQGIVLAELEPGGVERKVNTRSIPSFELGKVEFNKEMNVAKAVATVSNAESTKGLMLQGQLPRSFLEPELHGILARAPSKGADEDDVALAQGLDTFGNFLGAADSQQMLTSLTVKSSMRIPLLLGFFAEARAGALFSEELRQLLWTAVTRFGPQTESSHPALVPGDARSEWTHAGNPFAGLRAAMLGLLEDKETDYIKPDVLERFGSKNALAAPRVAECPKTAPASREQLGSTYCGLWHELVSAPEGTIDPLIAIAEEMSRLAGNTLNPTFITPFVFVCRLAGRVMAAATTVLRLRSPHPAAPSAVQRERLAARRQALRMCIELQLSSVLDFYVEEAGKTQKLELSAMAKTHWALMREGFTVAELGDEGLGMFMGNISFFHTYHGLGKQHVMKFAAPEYRNDAPSPPPRGTQAGGDSDDGKGSSKEGMEAPYLQSALRAAELDVFNLIDARRAEIVGYLNACFKAHKGGEWAKQWATGVLPALTAAGSAPGGAAASGAGSDDATELMRPTGDVQTALTMAKRAYSSVMDAEWGAPSEAMHKNGAFQDEEGKIAMDGQMCRIQASSGGDVQPLPAGTVNKTSFFGKLDVPFCTVLQRSQQVTKFQIMTPPSLAGYGDIEVHHWKGVLVNHYGSQLSAMGMPQVHADGISLCSGTQDASKTKKYNVRLGPGQASNDRSPDRWVSSLLQDTWIWALKEAAADLLFPNSPNKDKHAERKNRASALLGSVRIYGDSTELESGGDEVVLYAVDGKGAIRQVVLRRARQTCDVYYFQEFARRAFPVVHWTSDLRFCLGQLDPYNIELSQPVPVVVQFRCGDCALGPLCMDGIEVVRSRLEPDAGATKRVRYGLVPTSLLNGSLPAALLEKGLQWWLREDSQLLIGEPRPASFTRAVAGIGQEKAEGEEGGKSKDKEDENAAESKSPLDGEDAVYMVQLLQDGIKLTFLSPHVKSSARVVRKPLFPGMNGDGAAAAAAMARYPGVARIEEDDDGCIARPPGLKPDCLLLDLYNAPPGSPLDRLAVSLARAESLSHMLAWTHDPEEARGGKVPPIPWPILLEPDEQVELQSVELPRLDTMFECRTMSDTQRDDVIESAKSRGHGTAARASSAASGGASASGASSARPARLYLSDRANVFLCDRRTAGQPVHNYLATGEASETGDDGVTHASPGGGFEANAAPPPLAEDVGENLGPQALMKGLRHSLLLESDAGALSLYVPSHKQNRPIVKCAPFSTWTLQARGSIAWWIRCRSKSFVLDVSVSESFLKLPSVCAALYYLNCLLREREYELATRLLQSIDTDRALSSEETFWLNQVGELADDITPDMNAIRVKLALALRFGSAKMPFGTGGAYGSYMSAHGHVRASCRLSRIEHQAVCDMLDNKDMSEKWRALRYGDSIRATYSTNGASEGNFGWYGTIAEGGLHTADYMSQAQIPTETKSASGYVSLTWPEDGNRNWCFSTYGYEPIGDLSSSAKKSVDKINSLLPLAWNQHTPYLIELALGKARIRLVEGGEECGRRFAQVLTRWMQAKLLGWKPYTFSGKQMVPYYIGAIASVIDADGSPATEGSSGGWPVPTTEMLAKIQTSSTQTWVRSWFQALKECPTSSNPRFDKSKWAGKENEIPWGHFPPIRLGLGTGADDGTANPPQDITSDLLPPDPPGCFDTCPDRALVLRKFDHSGIATASGAASGSGKGHGRRGSVSGGGVGMDVSVSKLDLAQFATMPLGLLAEEHTLVLSAAQSQVRVPSGSLPFDKTTGRPIESSFVADAMLKRLEDSCATYKEIVAGRTSDAMACLVVDANTDKQRHPKPEELSAIAGPAIASLQRLLQQLVKQRREDLKDVRKGFASVLAVLNRIEEVDTSDDAPAAAASGAGSSDRPPLVVKTSLERHAFQRTYVWDELLLGTLLSSRPEQDLFNQNPCMSAERARAAVECAHALALKANRVSQANRCIGLAQRLAGMLGKIQSQFSNAGAHFGSDAVSPEQMEALRYAQEDLAGSLRGVRPYASIFPNVPIDYHKLAEGAADAREVQEISMDSRFLMLELINGWLLRGVQVDVVGRFCEEACVPLYGLPPSMQFGPNTGLPADQMFANKPGFTGSSSESKGGEEESKVEPPVPVDDDGVPDLAALEKYISSLDPSGSGVQSRVRSLAMGAGKTACISVLLILAMADGKRVATIMAPPALLAQTQDLMWAAFARIMPKRVVTFNFTRSSADNPSELAALRRKLEDTAEQRGLVLTSPGAVKSMQLLFVEQAGKALGTDGKGSIRLLSQESRKQAMEAAKELAQITDMFGRSQGGRLVMDEVDMILSPLKSELLYPAGNTVMLQPRPYRWTFVVDLLETITTAALLEGAGDSRRCALIAVDSESAGSGAGESKGGDEGGDKASLADVQSGRGPMGPFRRAIRQGLDQQMLQSSPHLVLLNKGFYHQVLRPAAAEWSVWWLMSSNVLQAKQNEEQSKATDSPVSGKDLELILQADPKTTEKQAKACLRKVAATIGPKSQAALRIVLDWLNSLLAHVLGKVNRVTYGILGPGDVQRLQAMGGDGLGRERLLTAVPFVGKDVPSEMSSFAQPDCLIGITTSAYLYEGLMPRHVKRLVQVQRFKMGRESGPHRTRPSRIEFQGWVEDAMRVWRVRFGDAADAIARARQAAARSGASSASFIPTAEQLDLSEDAYNEAAAGPPMVPPLEFLQTTDAPQMAQVFRLFRLFGPMVRSWMLMYVFPTVTDHQEAKFSSSGVDLGSDCLFGARYGFSGTPSALAPLDLGECDFEPGSEGRFLDVLTDPQVVWDSSDELIPGREWTVPGLLKSIANTSPPFHALIDAGALITGMSNRQAAAYMLRVGLKTLQGCVFLDEDNQKMILVRGKSEALPLAEAGIPKHKRFTIYDQSHTTGMDIKQAPNARAVLTLGKDCTFRDAAQAAWRMRGLAKGQTLRLCVVPEVQGLVKQAVGAEAFEKDPRIRSVVAWLVRNSIEHESLQFQQLCRQDLANVWRRAAFDDLMSIFGIAGRQYAEKGLVQDLRTVQERVSVFREPVDFTPKLDLEDDPSASVGAAASQGVSKDPAESAPLAGLARWARDTIPQYIRGEAAEKRLLAVLERNSIGAGVGGKKKTQHLDQEQEQEQEVLQEAEREQDQEKELEYVAWFKRPDIDVRKPSPWSIASLESASRKVQNFADSGDAVKAQSALLGALGQAAFHASEWKPDDDTPMLQALRPGLCLSKWFTLQDAQNLPEYKVQFAQVGMTFNALEPDPRGASAMAVQAGGGAAAAAGYRPGGGAIVPALSGDSQRRMAGATPMVILSLAEAEAVRRALHAASRESDGGRSSSSGDGKLAGVQLWNISLGQLIDSAGAGGPSSCGGKGGGKSRAEVTRAPTWDVRVALGRFANCDVYMPDESATAALVPLAGVPTDDRRVFFERLARRRRGGATAWAGTPVAKLLTVKDLQSLKHRDEQVQRVRQALASKGWDPDRLFKELDDDRSGTLSVAEFRKLVSTLNLPLPEGDVMDLLHAADRDMDGFVTMTEFRRAFAAVEDS